MRIPFIGQTDPGKNPGSSNELSLNWYIDNGVSEGTSLVAAPGQILWGQSASPAGEANALINLVSSANFLYIENDTSVYRLFGRADTGPTSNASIGTLSNAYEYSLSDYSTDSAGVVLINAVASSSTRYSTVATTTGLTTVSDADFPEATRSTWLDGRFIVNDVDNPGRFYISSQFPTASELATVAWDATDFATAESTSDEIVSLQSFNNELWIFGTQSVEMWYNSGAADFPLEPNRSKFLNIGCMHHTSVAQWGDHIFWLTESPSGGVDVVKCHKNGEYELIATPGMANEFVDNLRADTSPTPLLTTVGNIVHLGKHIFYVLSLVGGTYSPGAATKGACFAYDMHTGTWSRWDDLAGTNIPIDVHYASGRHFAVIDGAAGVYHLHPDIAPGECRRRSQRIRSDNATLFHHAVEVEFYIPDTDYTFYNDHIADDMGSGTLTIYLRWSDDDGDTWTSEKSLTLGTYTSLGVATLTTKRAVWRKLGYSKDRIYELRWDSSEMRCYITDAFIRVSQSQREV